MLQTVELMQILEAREHRACRQQELLAQYGLPLVSFCMNIAGPIKNSPLIAKGYRLGRRQLLEQLKLARIPVIYEEQTDAATGCETLLVVDAGAQKIKDLACTIEEQAPLGRLYDMDVIGTDGMKLDRPEPRRCLICGASARECARSRTHSVAELQSATKKLLRDACDAEDAETAARLAVQALLYEVCVTPKPGLVDRANSGSHKDMDIYTFMASASALWPYFAACVRIGRETAELSAPETLAALRWQGKLAECNMLRATGGVNTHKGAIYSLGLLCGALGRLERGLWAEPAVILDEIAAMTKGVTAQELQGVTARTASTAGQRLYAQYGVTGVRGEAEKGFPSVLQYGLPTLEAALTAGKDNDTAGAAALLTLLLHTADTNMLSRGGRERCRKAEQRIGEILAQGDYPKQETLEALDRAFIAENLSPGGSADLLSLCWMLHFLREVKG